MSTCNTESMTSRPTSDEPGHGAGGVDALVAALEESQRLGFLGERPMLEAIDHARAYSDAIRPVAGTVIDLGAGGGLPGLVLAFDRPDLEFVLLDRRAKRTDYLRRVVRRLGWPDRVAVVCADAATASQLPEAPFDAVVARGFGPPRTTLGMAAPLVADGGRSVISEPPDRNRWDESQIADLGVRRLEQPDSRVVIFVPAS